MEGLDIDNTEFKDIYGFSKATISGIGIVFQKLLEITFR